MHYGYLDRGSYPLSQYAHMVQKRSFLEHIGKMPSKARLDNPDSSQKSSHIQRTKTEPVR